MSTKVILPVGRLVSGRPYGSKTNPKTKQLYKDKVTGENYVLYRVRVAIPKTPGATHFTQEGWGLQFWNVATAEAPQHYQLADFAWKIQDGDSNAMDKSKQIINQREGFAGHWIVTAEGKYPPMYGYFDRGRPVQCMAEEHKINLGDYVALSVNIQAQTSGETPSLMVYPNTLILNSKGQPIQSQDTFDETGFQQNTALGSPIPMGHPAGMPPQGLPPQGLPPVQQPAYQPAPQPAYAPAPVAPYNQAPIVPQPQPQFLGVPATPPVQQPVYAPQPAPMAAPLAPAPAAGPRMTAKAGAFTLQQYLASGWDMARLVSEGYVEV